MGGKHAVMQGIDWSYHLIWVALILAMLMPRQGKMRWGVALAGLIGVWHGWERGDVPGLALPALVMLASAAPLLRLIWERATIQFSAEEEAFRASHFSRLTRHSARHLIDQGHWISAKAGEELTRENAVVTNLVYLASGSADVWLGGRQVGNCGPGDMIGEATALDGDPATGTVVLAQDARIWFMPTQTLRSYVVTHPEVRSALRESFALALRGKLRESNRALASQIEASAG